jgi:hypothetical protein
MSGVAPPPHGAALRDGRPILVFDVVETLLDTAHLETALGRIFGDPGAVRTWLDRGWPCSG